MEGRSRSLISQILCPIKNKTNRDSNLDEFA